MSAAVAGAATVPGAAPVVDGAVAVGGPGTAAGRLGGSSDDGVPDIAHHTSNATAAAAITLIKSRSMVASTHAQYITRHSGKSSKENLIAAHARQRAYGSCAQRCRPCRTSA